MKNISWNSPICTCCILLLPTKTCYPNIKVDVLLLFMKQFFFFFRHPSDVDNLIAYVKENHWFGGHKVCLSLDVGKTILNRSMKLVLHNNSSKLFGT